MSSKRMFGIRPGRVADDQFPIESRVFDSPRGRMHYVDEGRDEPILLELGKPSRAFEFRGPIANLRDDFRCMAPDHIGFGLSERSPKTEDPFPESHAKSFAPLPDHLRFDGVTLYLTDWGGPVGLDFAIANPGRVRRLILSNTWCWPVYTDRHFVTFSRMMSSPMGRLLNLRFNFFVNQVMPRPVGERKTLGPEVMRHYRLALPDSGSMSACAALPRHIIGASDWLDAIWSNKETSEDAPSFVPCGHKDIVFRQKELDDCQVEMADYQCHSFEQCGHFLAEEDPDSVSHLIAEFMQGNPTDHAGSGRKHG